jgi:hypothetical protein
VRSLGIVPLNWKSQLALKLLAVGGVTGNLLHSLFNLRYVQSLVVREFGASHFSLCFIAKVNPLKVLPVDMVSPDAEMPNDAIFARQWFIELLAIPPHWPLAGWIPPLSPPDTASPARTGGVECVQRVIFDSGQPAATGQRSSILRR